MEREYTAKDVEVLRDGEHIRRRPGMYVGSADERGVLYLVNHFIEQSLGSKCQFLDVEIDSDGSLQISDDGGIWPTQRDTLHGLGHQVAGALSTAAVFRVAEDQTQCVVEYRDGERVPTTLPLSQLRARFRPDSAIFGSVTFSATQLEERLRELAALHPERGFRFRDGREIGADWIDCSNAGGLPALLAWHNRDLGPEDLLTSVCAFSGSLDRMTVQVVLQWTALPEERIRGYVNDVPANEGTHIHDLRAGVCQVLRELCSPFVVINRDSLRAEDLCEGLAAVIHIEHPEPFFSSQSRNCLTNLEVGSFVRSIVAPQMRYFFEQHSELVAEIIERATTLAQLRRSQSVARRRLDRRDEAYRAGLSG
jgi:DNA gyrase subunit B